MFVLYVRVSLLLSATKIMPKQAEVGWLFRMERFFVFPLGKEGPVGVASKGREAEIGWLFRGECFFVFLKEKRGPGGVADKGVMVSG